MKRVLWVIHYPVFGGPHNEVLRLSRPLRERGFEVTVALPQDSTASAERLRDAGIPVIKTRLHRMRMTPNPVVHARYAMAFRRDISTLAEVIERTEADLVHLSGLHNPQAAFAARRAGIPLLWQVVDRSGPLFLRLKALKLANKYARAILVAGPNIAEEARSVISVPLLTYLPPVDTDLFSPSHAARADVREELGFAQDALVVGMVGGISRFKGTHIFVEAAGKVSEVREDARFMVVGPDYNTKKGYSRHVRKVASRYPALKERLIFLGGRADVHRMYPAMDIKVLTSFGGEGAPTAIEEALACGVPVIGTSVNGADQLVVEGETGLVVRPGDADEVARAILDLGSDGSRLAEMGTKGRTEATKRFAVEQCAAVFQKAYNRVLGIGPEGTEPEMAR